MPYDWMTERVTGVMEGRMDGYGLELGVWYILLSCTELGTKSNTYYGDKTLILPTNARVPRYRRSRVQSMQAPLAR